MRRHLTMTIPLIFLALLSLAAIFPRFITPHSYSDQHSLTLLASPGGSFLLGTDELGRDLLARILFGARISLACALLATFISALFGLFYGSLSGFFGGKPDQLLMRIVDILYSIPDLLFYILLGLFLGRDFWGLLIALSSLSWVGVARIVRGEVLKYKQMSFVESARALGLSPMRILWRHLIPQTTGPLLVSLIFKVPAIILAESTLSFVGLGIQPPFASWGTLAHEGYQAFPFFWHLIFFPSLFVFATILCFQILGNHLLVRLKTRK